MIHLRASARSNGRGLMVVQTVATDRDGRLVKCRRRRARSRCALLGALGTAGPRIETAVGSAAEQPELPGPQRDQGAGGEPERIEAALRHLGLDLGLGLLELELQPDRSGRWSSPRSRLPPSRARGRPARPRGRAGARTATPGRRRCRSRTAPRSGRRRRRSARRGRGRAGGWRCRGTRRRTAWPGGRRSAAGCRSARSGPRASRPPGRRARAPPPGRG